MSDVVYGRTKSYSINKSNQIDYSRIKTSQDTYTIVDFTANAISFPNSFACTTGGGSAYAADCPASSVVTLKAGYPPIYEVY